MNLLLWSCFSTITLASAQHSNGRQLGDYRIKAIPTQVVQNPIGNNNLGANNGAIGNARPLINQYSPFTPVEQIPGTVINSNVLEANNGIGAEPNSFGNADTVLNPGSPSVVAQVPPVTIPSIVKPPVPPSPPVDSPFIVPQPATTSTPPVTFPSIVQPPVPPSPPVDSPLIVPQPATPSPPPVTFPPITQPALPPVITSTPVPLTITPPPPIVNFPPILQPAAPSPVTSPPIPPASAGPLPNSDVIQGAAAPLSCHIRQCDQTVTGRGLSYSRALEILQDEEYLTEADLDVIRIKRLDIGTRFKRQIGPTVPGPSPSPDPVKDGYNIILPEFPVIIICVIIVVINFSILSLLTPSSNGNFDPNPDFPTGFTGQQTGPGEDPGSSPLPGEFGGGQLPIGNSFLVLEALSLVPDGLQAVSVFPPFIRPRTYDAVGVIFREQISNFQRRFGSRRRLPIVQRMKQAWSRYFGSNRRDNGGQGYHGHDSTFGFVDQTFEEDIFGFRIRVTLVNETCTLGLTCDANGNKISSFGFTSRIDDFYDRQTGQEFTSDAPPDCRTILNPNGCT